MTPTKWYSNRCRKDVLAACQSPKLYQGKAGQTQMGVVSVLYFEAAMSPKGSGFEC